MTILLEIFTKKVRTKKDFKACFLETNYNAKTPLTICDSISHSKFIHLSRSERRGESALWLSDRAYPQPSSKKSLQKNIPDFRVIALDLSEFFFFTFRHSWDYANYYEEKLGTFDPHKTREINVYSEIFTKKVRKK